MRALGITVISLALTAGVITNAYYQKKQFYPSVVYITKSNPSMAVIYIQAFILVLLVGKLMRKVFFGQLRAAEFEHLMERSWYAVTETCLAFTVFRDDFNPKFVALFTVLLFLKSFHWLAEDRVDYMERSPVIGWLFHARVLGLLGLLGILDVHFLGLAYHFTVTKGASVQLVFGFEYAILLTMVANTAIKYCLHAADLRSEAPWDGKAVLLLYSELAVGFLRVLLYVAFVAIMVRIYTLPLFAFRPMYYTMRNFKKAFNDVILSRRAIRNMNTLYPDATPQELIDADNVCIICREEMNANAKKLPCNHIFHTACLRSWFQRQQTCPTCRLDILRPAVPPTPQAAPAQPAADAQQAAVPNVARPANAANVLPTPNVNTVHQIPFQPFVPPANMAPFPFPVGLFPPPPTPPDNLGIMTNDELRAMEGIERCHIEARIKYLRNIQMMLDASIALMQNYQMITARMPPVPPSRVPTPTHPSTGSADFGNPGTSATSSEASALATPLSPPPGTTEDVKSGPNLGQSESEIPTNAQPSTSETAVTAEAVDDVSDFYGVDEPANRDLSGSPNDEIRRRRLKRFEATD